ncbi:MAG: hypothetical protein U0M12_01610 [Acutalibacteraceae bacterium]|nr:hypothetical protein [Acutalibacteraceae bacterium]
MSEQVINLLAVCASIMTLITGVISFLGNRKTNIFQFLFLTLLFLTALVFLKEFIIYDDFITKFIIMFTVVITTAEFVNLHREHNFDKTTYACFIILFFTMIALWFNSEIINIGMLNFKSNEINYIKGLSQLDKVYDVFEYIFRKSNVIYTFKTVFNTVICILIVKILVQVYINEDTNIECIDRIKYTTDIAVIFSIILLILSCGVGVWLMNEIVSRF